MSTSSIRVDEGAGPYIWTDRRSVSSVNREAQYVLAAEPALPTFIASFYNISIATTDDHVIQVMGSASLYTRVNRIVLYQMASTTATNAAYTAFRVYRLTSAGTGGTSVTPAALDTADTASATAMTLASSKGTESTALMPFGLVIRKAVLDTSSQDELVYEWTPAPRSKPLIIPTGAANGIAIKVLSGRASATVGGYVEFSETAWL